MLSFLNDTQVETPCIDFFRRLPKEVFSKDSKFEQLLLDITQTTEPCVYGDQTIGDRAKWKKTMEAEIICADALRDFLRAYLGGEKSMPQVYSYTLQAAIVKEFDKETNRGKTNALISMVEDDFIARKIQKAYEMKPEVVVENFPASYFMYQMKNIPTPLRSEQDARLFRCNYVFYTENDSEPHFSNLFQFAMRKRAGQVLSVEFDPMSHELFERIENAVDGADSSKKKAQHAYLVCKRGLTMRREQPVNTL